MTTPISMTLAEARQAEAFIANTISRLLHEFELATTLRVTKLELTHAGDPPLPLLIVHTTL